MRLRVGLNLLHAVPDIGGGWNYIQNLVAALAAGSRRHDYVVFSNRISARLVPAADNFRVMVMPVQAGRRSQRLLFEHSLLQAAAWHQRIDCMHWFANGQGLINWAPAVVTVYDLQPFVGHGTLSPAKRAFLQWNLRRAARHAAGLLPMSQTTAEALRIQLGADPNLMTVVPPILEPSFAPALPGAIANLREKYCLPQQFWLYVAHLYPHKNHRRLLHAFLQLKGARGSLWPLVLRGDDQGEPLGPLIHALGLDQDVVLLARLPREELPALYGAASAMVFPSLYEGAGIPVLEAQACGCPVLASDIPALREFAGDAAEYVDPLNDAAIAEGMTRVASDPHLRQVMRSRGLSRAQEFRSVNVVDLLHAAYENAASSRRRGPRFSQAGGA